MHLWVEDEYFDDAVWKYQKKGLRVYQIIQLDIILFLLAIVFINLFK